MARTDDNIEDCQAGQRKDTMRFPFLMLRKLFARLRGTPAPKSDPKPVPSHAKPHGHETHLFSSSTGERLEIQD